MHRSLAMVTLAVAAMISTPRLTAQSGSVVPPPKAPPPGFSTPTQPGSAKSFGTSVMIGIDAPGELGEAIQRYVREELAKRRDVLVVKENAEWAITITADEQVQKEEGPRRFAMATAFLRQVRYVDPALLDELNTGKGKIGMNRLKSFNDSQVRRGMMTSLRVSSGTRGELPKIVGKIIDDFYQMSVREQKAAAALVTPDPNAKPKKDPAAHP